MEETKRKTKTSSAAARRYHQKAYGSVTACIPKDVAEASEAKCAAEGVSQAKIIKKAVEEFLAQ